MFEAIRSFPIRSDQVVNLVSCSTVVTVSALLPFLFRNPSCHECHSVRHFRVRPKPLGRLVVSVKQKRNVCVKARTAQRVSFCKLGDA